MNTATKAAIEHFTSHAAAVKETEAIRQQTATVDGRLADAANASKPNFSTVSALHAERAHLVARLEKSITTAASLEKNYAAAGHALYAAANIARAAAGEAAVACVHARLSDDFTGDALAFVARHHPVLIAEDARAAFVPSPHDRPDFASFAAAVPSILAQIEQAEARAEIYRKATASRSLPSQAQLDAATPADARPTPIKPRRELTGAEEAARDEALLSSENKHLRDLFHRAKEIAGEFGENRDALNDFLGKHPEIARFFPRRNALV